MAPVAPFLTERVWQDLFTGTDPDGPDSVHLASWPTADESARDADLDASMQLAQRLVELGRAARSEAKIKIRQPLRRAVIPTASHDRLGPELRAEIAAELNLTAVESFTGAGDLVEYSAKGNFRALGKRFGKQTPVVAAAIAAADAAALAESLSTKGSATVDHEGGTEVTVDEVIISERPKEGWSVLNDQGETIALDLELTPDLISAGLAREVIRLIQETRKESGLEVTDRIRLSWSAGPDLAAALREHGALVADEVLAVESTEAEPGTDWIRFDDLGLALSVTKSS